ncbi:hypothetical protein [Bacillus timonensis]|uniref:hypothetical protein n=1 Tax=Bacillus timonensis TaxID=1033734 RepID=UPI000287D545|nr:hypothetical protein [Bacillus timonensis]
MKKSFKKWIWFLIIMALIGCSNENNTAGKAQKADGVLGPLKQNERNTQIISSLGFDTLLMYDLEIKNEDIKMIHFWVEHYKNGKKQENIIEGATATSKKMTLAATKLDFKLDEENTYDRWTYSVSDGTAISTMESLPMEVVSNDELGMGSTWVDDQIKIEAEKPITLAVIARHGGDGVGIGLGEEVIEDTIKNSDEVFIVKTMISKKEEYK